MARIIASPAAFEPPTYPAFGRFSVFVASVVPSERRSFVESNRKLESDVIVAAPDQKVTRVRDPLPPMVPAAAAQTGAVPRPDS